MLQDQNLQQDELELFHNSFTRILLKFKYLLIILLNFYPIAMSASVYSLWNKLIL